MRFPGRRPLLLVAVSSILAVPFGQVAASADAYPTASLSLPGGTDVAGTISVNAVGSVNPAGTDKVKSLTLYADGSAAGSAHTCDANLSTCSAALSWDSTGLSGAHQLSVKVLTDAGATGTSAVTTVSVTSPAPTAVVTTPVDGSEVAGFVSVTGSGAVDPSQTDSAQLLQFYVDGAYKAQKTCSGSDLTCTATFSWDTTTLYGPHSLQVRFRTANDVLAMSPSVSVQVGDPPTAAITSPASGAAVTGVVNVLAGGTVDDLQPDATKSLQLLVDGTATVTATCPDADPTVCPVKLAWDSTGTSGQHRLQVKLTTDHGQTALSPVVVVTANNPGPAVVLTAPSTVSGVTAIKIRGTVDPTQSDAGAAVRLLVDGVGAGTASCPAASRTCQTTVSWNPKGLAGQHNLQAQFTTTGGRTVLGALVPVWVQSAVKLVLAKPVEAAAGRSATVAGRVTAVDGSAVAGAKVRVVVQPSIGRGGVDVTVLTGPTGTFSATFKAVSSSTISASVAGSDRYKAAAASTRLTVGAVVTCTVRTAVGHGVSDAVVCHLGDLTKGTALTFQVQQGTSWRTLASTRSTGATWSFGQVFPARATAWVRLSVAATKDFDTGVSPAVKVVVS